MKQLELLSEHYNFTTRQEERIEDLVKDIAIGFIQWQVSMKCDYWWSAKRNMWIKYGLDNISITTEQLFNEYLNTLK